MRRKSERTPSKKTKASPEKKDKPEKIKRPKTRRRKDPSSSDNESTDETKAVLPAVAENVSENNPPQTSAKEDSPEETNEQVWQVKASEGDVGEIQKLKICLTRPPSTPERADRSPRSKRKHSRSASGEPAEERRKTRHRSKRSVVDSKDGSEKNQDSQGDELESEKDHEENPPESCQNSLQQEVTSHDTPMSTTTDDAKPSVEVKPSTEASASETVPTSDEKQSTDVNTATTESSNDNTKDEESKKESQDKPSDADTTVTSPKSVTEDSQSSAVEQENNSQKSSLCEEKSEILELHADESRFESSNIEVNDSQAKEEEPETSELPKGNSEEKESDKDNDKVSITGDKIETIHSETANSTEDKEITTNDNNQNVVETTKSPEKEVVSPIIQETEKQIEVPSDSNVDKSKVAQDDHEGPVHNGQTTAHSNRKRRWGSRPSRISTQKSITISTDVLKDIIPDVKPVEFDEVIEEKKHRRRVEVTEKLERPVLPKIVIDNTESIEINKKDDDRDKENVKIRESNLAANRKISIVKDSDSIIARPPSPPRHKQSSILFITNLVRPFTLPQLKNLLQRTGRIVDNGFWIDRIKSKCFVHYETEDQAVETRHALHGVTWPVSNPKTLHVDFSTQEDFNKAKANEDTESAQTSTIPGTVEDWLREQDLKRERGEMVTEKPWERKMAMREWDVGKNEKGKEKDKVTRDDRSQDKRRHRTPERSPEPAKKFKKKEEEAPAKLLDDLFRKTKATPCIYWLPLSAETIAVKEEQRRQHMAEHERRLQELRRTHRRH